MMGKENYEYGLKRNLRPYIFILKFLLSIEIF